MEVEVRGLTENVDTDYMVLYFENKRRSGGGSVLSFTRNGSTAIITFECAGVAAQVLKRPHSLEKCELVVSPFYPDLLGSPITEDSGPLEEEHREADGIENVEKSVAQLPGHPVSNNKEQSSIKLEEKIRVQSGNECDMQEGKQNDFQEGLQSVAEKYEHWEGQENQRGLQTLSSCSVVTGQYKEPDTLQVVESSPVHEKVYMAYLPDPTPPALSSGNVEVITEVDSSMASVKEVEVLMETAELRFIQEYHHDLLAGMDQVTIVPLDMEDKFGFSVTGDAVSCKTAVELLQHIESSLSSRTVTLEYPGVSLFLLEEDGQRALSETEHQHHCIIDTSQLSWKALDCNFVDPWNFVHHGLQTESSSVQTTMTEEVSEPEDPMLAAEIEGIKKIASLLRSVESEGDRHNESLSDVSPATTTDWNIPPENIVEDIYTDMAPEGDDKVICELKDEELDQACKISRDEYQDRELDEEAQLLLAIQRSMDTQEIHMEEDDEELQRALELSLTQHVLEESEESLQRALEMSLCDKGLYGHIKTFTAKEVVQPMFCNEMERASDSAHIKVLAGDETSLVVACAALRKTITAKLCTVTLEGIRDLRHNTEILSALERKHRVRITVSDGQAHIQGFLQCPTKCRQELSQILSALHEGAKPQAELMSLDVQQKVEMIPLLESSEEYNSVVQPFLSTLQQQKPITKVLQVQKVQNTLLYNQYQLKKQSMLVCEPKKPIEHTLYHGTTKDGAREICHHGFNRSFCGKNATLYGQGVYFAVEAEISTLDNYSPPSTEGKKFVLVAQVLTGEFVVGKPDMRTPPIMPNSNGDVSRRYDSLADNLRKPSIFVIFNDTQAYPQYLITCCKERNSSM
ncbi:protein mono-ADP-ribosyltransferase PARP10 isoform X2 [Mixophyes fleayi]|uniref:protein mono-ADP-ribosyltransferase PARP10 isoform X2 n=1 Tax=Mixophyes fleayi TaxID=3061075 RepID=UPI003F4E0622